MKSFVLVGDVMWMQDRSEIYEPQTSWQNAETTEKIHYEKFTSKFLTWMEEERFKSNGENSWKKNRSNRMNSEQINLHWCCKCFLHCVVSRKSFGDVME